MLWVWIPGRRDNVSSDMKGADMHIRSAKQFVIHRGGHATCESSGRSSAGSSEILFPDNYCTP